MTGLRSREISPKTPLKTLKKPPPSTFQPSTPAKTLEIPNPVSSPSMDSSLTPPKSESLSDHLPAALGSCSTGQPRRSLRLAGVAVTPDSGSVGGLNVKRRRSSQNRKDAKEEIEKSHGGGDDTWSVSETDTGKQKGEPARTPSEKKARVFCSLEGNGLRKGELDLNQCPVVMDSENENCAGNSEANGAGKITGSRNLGRRSGRFSGINSMPNLNSVSNVGNEGELISSRTVRVGGIENSECKKFPVSLELDGNAIMGSISGHDGKTVYGEDRKEKAKLLMETGLNVDLSSSVFREKKPTKEDKGKGKLLEDNLVILDSEEDLGFDLSSLARREKKHSAKGRVMVEEGKEQLDGNDSLLLNGNWEKDESNKKLLGKLAPAVAYIKEGHVRQEAGSRRRSAREVKERFRDTAKEFASKFAYFNPDEEEGQSSLLPGNEVEPADEADPTNEVEPEIEEWPGPVSTAKRINADREAKRSTRQECSAGGLSKLDLGPTIEWTPRNKSDSLPSNQFVPSLVDKCLQVLCKYAEHISSLEGLPESLKRKLSGGLCDSRKMDSRVLGLLFSGSPFEIIVNDCSAITEEQLKVILGSCKIVDLEVLQLDLSGRCMSDYLLRDTLACSPNNMPALVTVSLKGACRLTDDGLKVLLTSAPSLMSINLSQCCLLTSTGINTIADKLGSTLKKLYIDDCQGIDAMLITGALKKLEHLEVFSVARSKTVSDKFVRQLVYACGQNMRELGLADCGNLTDTSLKVIAEKCPLLSTLDVAHLQKLTDSSLQYIANGCRAIQVLKLRRNAFSDEAVAAFVESRGESLKELSLNNIKKVANYTAKAIAIRCSSSLQRLDLSFCLKLKDEALGLIVDSCCSLRLLKLFGCSQVTNAFLDGHSNKLVKIIGLKESQILDHMDLV